MTYALLLETGKLVAVAVGTGADARRLAREKLAVWQYNVAHWDALVIAPPKRCVALVRITRRGAAA